MSEKKYNNSTTKKNQKTILLVSGISLAVIFLGIMYLTGGDEKQQENVVNHSADQNISTNAGDSVSDMEVYTANTQSDLMQTQNLVNDLQSRVQALQENESNNRAELTMQMQQQFDKINSQLEDIKNTPPAILNGVDGLPSKNIGGNSDLPPMESIVETPQIQTVNLKQQQESNTSNGDKSASSGSKKIKTTKTYLPTSFVKAKLITALDAPCGGTAQDNPFPVLLNITGNAQLPNKFRTQLKGCFALASAYGEVASERAYMRLEKISCVGKNGETIDMKAEGYIAGEDGKAGLRGTLVSKAGSKIALALLSGTVGGLAAAFAQTATTLQQTPIGPTQIVTPQQSLGYAGATGISSGFQQLSQYYINMAEKTFPVIEINDQRNVTVVFTGGLDFPIDVNSDLDTTTKTIPIMVN